MSTTTEKYKLTKPELSDPADITALNTNWDTIDSELAKRASLVDGKVPSSELPKMDYVPTSDKGKAGGVATLGADGKVPAGQLGVVEVTGAASTIQTSNLTANRALVSNGNGKVGVSAVTSTELGYLDGAKSNIQTQINNKVNNSGGTLSGMLTFQNTDAYHAIHKYRNVDGVTYGVNLGCGVLGGEGMVAIEAHRGNSTDSPIVGRLEVGRYGVSYQNGDGKRTYLHRNAAVDASVEN